MNKEDLDIQREWGFLPPEGEQWPVEVGQTTQAILRQQSNAFFAVILNAARLIHYADGAVAPEANYQQELGKVDLLTDMVFMYCWYQLGGSEPVHLTKAETAHSHVSWDVIKERRETRRRARAVVGQLLQHLSEQHSKRMRMSD